MGDDFIKPFYLDASNAIRYALSDWKAIVVIGGFLFLSSVSNKYVPDFSILKISNLLMIFVVGYGSYISFSTIKGKDKPPEIGRVRKILWEGFKKSIVISIYSVFLTFFYHHARLAFDGGDILISVICEQLSP